MAFLCIPAFTGLLDYRSLPGEFFDPAKYKILQSHTEDGWPSGLGTYEVPDSWSDEATGTIYSADIFSVHHRAEARRLGLAWFCYGLIGCAFFAGRRAQKVPGAFFRALRISLLINATISLFVFWMT